MTKLPEEFIKRMKKELPESEWGAFFAVYEKPPYTGARVNTLKARLVGTPFAGLPRVAWEENGFYTEEKIGSHPYHFAGVLYSQEPSAMSSAPLLEVKAGERVLDLCSAPGGKGTRLAADLQGDGLIVLNEPILSRAKILSQNVERMGIENAVVTCAYPDALAEILPEYFDKIMVDAPCSGEGMFRKNADAALSEWSEENVALCADRQAEILSCAVKMLKGGGKLAYSTCTFAPEEDERQVESFLRSHTEMRLLQQEKLLPHKIAGEGHFVALFEKTSGAESELKRAKRPISRATEKLYREFETAFFTSYRAENLCETGGALYAFPADMPDLGKTHILRAGVRLGEVANGRFEPSHALVMARKKEDFRNVVDLDLSDGRVEKYLRGETIESDGANGWCAVLVDGYPLGLGKRVNGTVKNHLPKGLRKHG